MNTVIRSKALLGLSPMLSGLVVLGLVGCGETQSTPGAQSSTIVEVATKAGTFTTLVSALGKTGLDKTLSGPGPFTVFAPTDDAFARLPSGLLASLDNATLSTILSYHVHPGKAPAAAVVGLKQASTAQGEQIAIALEGNSVYLNGVAKVVMTDIAADNGIIHVIDAVLLPQSIDFPGTIVDQLKSSPRFSTLVSAVVKADLATALSGDNQKRGFTVFAPTNAAFTALGLDLGTIDAATLSNVLLYHVVGSTIAASQVVGLSSATTLEGKNLSIAVSGGTVTLDGEAKVISTDWKSQNGIVHIIDAVLTP